MYTNKNNILGPNIKFYREKLNMTQDDFIAKLQDYGFICESRSIISKIENQSRVIKDFEVKIIADALEVSINDLYST